MFLFYSCLSWVFLGRLAANQDEYFTYFFKITLPVFLGRFWIFITEYFTRDFGIDLAKTLSYNRTKKN